MAGRAKERTIRRAHHLWLDIVHGERARLYVHDQEQATLIADDLKTGAEGKGAVALWHRSRNRRALPQPDCAAIIREIVVDI